MNVREQIDAYIAGQPEPKRGEMETLHRMILEMMPGCGLWFLDGKDEAGKIVSNPQIGYGSRTVDQADGTSRELFRIGLSANTAGISVYIMGLPDRKQLPKAFGKRIGKAKVTGYCVKFRRLEDIDIAVLGEAVRCGLEVGEGV